MWICLALSSGRLSPAAKRPRTEVQTNNEDKQEEDNENEESESEDSVDPPEVWDLALVYNHRKSRECFDCPCYNLYNVYTVGIIHGTRLSVCVHIFSEL